MRPSPSSPAAASTAHDVHALQSAVLPEGVAVEHGPATRPPADFADGYVLPVHTEKPLQRLHRTALDDDLEFFEKPHVYTFRGKPLSQSVTGLAHSFEKEFVPAEAIEGMKTARSQRWPRLEYVLDARLEAEAAWTPARGALLVAGGKTIASVHPHALGDQATRAHMLDMIAASCLKGATGIDEDDDAELYTFEREKTAAEITAGWAAKGQLASHLGTEGHWLAECFFNGLPCRWWEGEMRVVLDFVARHMVPRGIVAWNTEKEIVCEDADLAGSIDLIVYEPRTGLHHIVDFKRSDKLRKDLRGYGKMRGEFSHLDDCKGAGYALQTSIYQYVLAREYGMSFGDRILLSIHPDQPFATSVPYLFTEVDWLLQRRMQVVAARREAAREAPATCACALSGQPLAAAVRLADGRLAMEKAALLHELEYTVDEAARAAFEREVERRTAAAAPLARALCKPWRKQMPEGGLQDFFA